LPADFARLAPVSRQGFASQTLAEQLTHFIRELRCCSPTKLPARLGKVLSLAAGGQCASGAGQKMLL
jgi:hypothetical protein